MKLKADLFPYPVLSRESDDFSRGKFVVHIEQRSLSITKLLLSFKFILDNVELEQLIKQNKARFGVHIEGQASVYRKLIFPEAGETSLEIELDSETSPKKIFVNMFVIAAEQITDYKNSGINTEYYGEDFVVPVIEKGSILAYDVMAELDIKFKNLNPSDVKSMIRIASKTQKFMDVDIDGNVIQVNLPEKSYLAYVNLSNSSKEKQMLLLSTIILPALTMVIERIKSDEVDESLEWYESLKLLLEKIDYNIDEIKSSSESPMLISQKLLDFPLESSLYNFYEVEESINEG